MKNVVLKKSLIFAAVLAAVTFIVIMAVNPVFAADEAAETAAASSTGFKAIGAAIVVGLAGLGGALAMGNAIAKSSEGIARQPEASGNIRTSLMLGLVFIETVVIYALIVAILIIFVL